MLNDKSWKDRQVSRKQTKASPTASTSEEKENVEKLVNGSNMFVFLINRLK